jgi:hypothetical protein
MLYLDSKAVAAWLAIKPDGWAISITALCQRLGKNGRMLGKDKWQRIARELESAGYLQRERRNRVDGQWQWHIRFNPVPSSASIAGFPGTGSAGSGCAGAGESGDKGIPMERSTKRRTTTTVPSELSPEAQAVDYTSVILDERAEPHREMLIALLRAAGVGFDPAQQIADELAGRLEAAARGTHGQVRSVRAWLAKLIESYVAGTFVSDFGRSIATRRRQLELHQRKPASESLRVRSEIAEESMNLMRETLARSRKYVG